MTISTDGMIADLLQIEADIAQAFVWDGTSYACVAGEIGHDKETLEMAGYTDERRVSIVARQALFSTLPAIGDQITHGGSTWRIVTTELDPFAVTINLTCEEIKA